MPLPLIVALLTAGVATAGLASKQVKAEQEKAIRDARLDAVERLRREVNRALNDLEHYERKSLQQIYWASACLVLLVLFLGTNSFLAEWVAFVALFLSMYLLADLVALYFFNPKVREYLGLAWKDWVDKGRRIRWAAVTQAIESAVISDIRGRVASEDVWSQIKGSVDDRINSLNTIDTVFYNMFGDSRENLAQRIQDEILKEVDLGSVTKSVKRVVSKILIALVAYSIIAFLVRLVVWSLAGLTFWLWCIAVPCFFLCSFFYHRYRLKSVDSV